MFSWSSGMWFIDFLFSDSLANSIHILFSMGIHAHHCIAFHGTQVATSHSWSLMIRNHESSYGTHDIDTGKPKASH